MGVGAGSKGSSESKSTTSSSTSTTDSTVNNADYRAVQGENANIGGNVSLNASAGSSVSGVTVSTTDFGAVSAGISTALKALDSITEANRINNQGAQDAISRSIALAGNSSGAAGAQTTQDFIRYGGIVAGIGLVAWVLVAFLKSRSKS